MLELHTSGFPTSANCYFDLANGVQGTEGAGANDSGMEDVGNGWYRCWVSATADATGTWGFFFHLATDDLTKAYTGDGTSSMYLTGMQIEDVTHMDSTAQTVGEYVSEGVTERGVDTPAYHGAAIDGFKYFKTALDGTTPLVKTATNEILHSRAFDNAAWTTASAKPVVTSGQTGIDGTANAYILEDDNSTTNTENLTQAITIEDDTNWYVASLYIKRDEDESRFPRLGLALSGGTGQSLYVHLNTKTGILTNQAKTGTACRQAKLVGGWWRLTVAVKNNASGNTTATFRIDPANGTIAGTGDVTAVGSCIVDCAQLETLKTQPGPPVTTTATAASGTGIAGFEQPGWWDYTSAPNLSNLVLDNTDLDNASDTDWTAVGGGPGTTTGGQTDPFGGTDGWLLEDTSGGGAQAQYAVVGHTSDGTKAASIYVKEGTAAVNEVAIYDSTAVTYRHNVRITWNSNVPSLSTAAGGGTLYQPIQIGSTGWWWIRFTATGVLTANVNRFYIFPAGSTVANTGTGYFAFPAAFDGAVAGHTVITVGAASSKNADYCQWNRPANTGTDGMAISFDVKHGVNEADESHARYFSTEGASTGDIRVASSSAWLWTVAAGAGYFSTDKAQHLEQTEWRFGFQVYQSGANELSTICENGSIVNTESDAGTLNHGDDNIISFGNYNGVGPSYTHYRNMRWLAWPLADEKLAGL
jgi:hypothetical protein